MNHRKHLYFLLPCMIVICLFWAGCSAEELLGEIPRDFVLVQESEPEMAQVLSEGFEEEHDEMIQKPPVFLDEKAGDYAFRCLNETEQIWYRDMEQLMGSFTEKGFLSNQGLEAGLDDSDIEKIFQCVLDDHPELFFVDGYAYTKYEVGGKISSLEFEPSYTMEESVATMRRHEILEAAKQILAGIGEDASEYERVKYVYEVIIENTDYEADAAENQNIYSVFIHHSSVCQGYAKATQYLLNHLGMECMPVVGSVESGECHAWNLVKVDGSYYYVDTTWGDASYQTEKGVDVTTVGVNYDYLNITTKQLLRTHTPNTVFTLPECTDTAANYYVREDRLFTFYDREKLQFLFENMKSVGDLSITIKCADESCYDEMRTSLIQEQEIFDFLEDFGRKVAFSENEKQLSLTFWVTNE